MPSVVGLHVHKNFAIFSGDIFLDNSLFDHSRNQLCVQRVFMGIHDLRQLLLDFEQRSQSSPTTGLINVSMISFYDRKA